MKSRHPVLFTLILLSILIAGSHLCAFDALREREPVIVFSNRFPQFINSPVEQIFAFAFDADTHTWRQIPHQIDERDAERGYFGEVNGLLDLNEEILFMAHDAGDRASPLYWPDNADSKNYTRYEFEISDPEFPGESRYIYLFRSTTLSNSPNLPSYLTYFPSSGGSDKVVGASYSEEHTDAIPKHWIIPPEAGGAGLDFLDRQKARVNGNHSIIGSLKLTEDDLNYKSGNIFYVAGPIRISRKAVFEIKIKKLGITLTAVDISFVKQYYPYHIHHLKANKKLDKEWGISLIRQSFDFNFNGIGMQFYNPYNHVLIDGVSDVIDHTMHLEPDYNWYCATGDAGTIVNIFQVDNVGSTQELYYWDKTNNTTYDGTKETGYDKKSYGDAGVLFRGSDMEGSLGMPMMIHFLAANQDSIIGPQLMDNLLNPLNIDIKETSFVENIIAEIPDTSQRQGLDIDIPIRLQDVSGLDLTSCDMTIAFDGSVIEALDASTTLMTA